MAPSALIWALGCLSIVTSKFMMEMGAVVDLVLGTLGVIQSYSALESRELESELGRHQRTLQRSIHGSRDRQQV